MYLVNSAAWYHEIVAICESQFTVHGAQRAAAFVHKDEFVGIGIFIKIILHAFLRRCEYYMAIVVDKDWLAALQEIFFRFYIETFKAAMFQHFFFGHLGCSIVWCIGADDICGRMAVIHQRIIVGKTFSRK